MGERGGGGEGWGREGGGKERDGEEEGDAEGGGGNLISSRCQIPKACLLCLVPARVM